MYNFLKKIWTLPTVSVVSSSYWNFLYKIHHIFSKTDLSEQLIIYILQIYKKYHLRFEKPSIILKVQLQKKDRWKKIFKNYKHVCSMMCKTQCPSSNYFPTVTVISFVFADALLSPFYSKTPYWCSFQNLGSRVFMEMFFLVWRNVTKFQHYRNLMIWITAVCS